MAKKKSIFSSSHEEEPAKLEENQNENDSQFVGIDHAEPGNEKTVVRHVASPEVVKVKGPKEVPPKADEGPVKHFKTYEEHPKFQKFKGNK